ncbi:MULTISPECIES: YdcF family protein [unclassified Fusibacter]|uniref:YdcF family protein n=1 Tax=unclassified Fusibacter TaxID=2624464 RepID=UPI00101053BD|nr:MULTISPECIES: YdcF family protein [unclassified Fusibacter]MCK8059591.1 YdcF family protein [Fusibacter sp. A2]NPE21392.1 YdcF family protein [Fusibacter sp. A1]RXV61808.1 YdcF family protein [Fusibacter sp. A1]
MHNFHKSITEMIFISDELGPADVILVAGGSRPELASKAAELYHRGLSEYVLVSGGENRKLKTHATECDYLTELLLKMDVPETAILKEDKAAHTFDNAVFSHELLKEKGVDLKKAILVCKTFHAKRCKLTYELNSGPDTIFMVAPVVDERKLTAENWYLKKEHAALVFDEIEKISKYFRDKPV